MMHASKHDHGNHDSCCHTPAPSLNEDLLAPLPPSPKPWSWLLSLALAGVSMGAMMWTEGLLAATVSGVSAALVILLFGIKFIKAIPKIFRTSDMNTLIGISVIASFGLSIWNISKGDYHHLYFETAAFVAAFVLFGQYLEALIQRRMNQQMSNLATLLPQKARRLTGSNESLVDLRDLVVGDRVRVLVGERVPTDSKVESDATFDLSVLTGESRPVTLKSQELVVQGALNVGQPCIVEVTKTSQASLYYQLVSQVRTSLAERPQIQKTVDRIATFFVPAVVLVAIGTGIFWWLRSPETTIFITTAISVLVVACPCALGMATPTALFVGALRAGRRGILLKSLEAIDRINEITMIAFDKTGTLTVGRPSVQRIKAIENIPAKEVLQLALSVEQESEHPYATALRNYSTQENLKPLKAKNLKIAPGRGVSGSVNFEGKEKEVVVGNLVWLFENDFDSTRVPGDLQWEAEGTTETSIWVGVDKQFLGIIFLADQIREGAAETIATLVDSGFDVGMITGDSDIVAKGIAKQLKLKFIHAGVLPQEKATLVKRLHEPKKKGLDFIYNKVAFVGDGVNDAPALAEAHLGIAMGSGAALSQSTADIVLLSNEIGQVGAALSILKQTRSLVTQNLVLCSAYNLLTIPLAAGVLYPLTGWLLNPAVAALAMAGSSVTVLLNSLRALRA